MRLELFLILMLILPFTCGCSDQGMSETLQVFLEADTLGTQAVVQTELPEEDLVNIVGKALISLDNKGHARQILRDNSSGKWKIFHTKLQ